MYLSARPQLNGMLKACGFAGVSPKQTVTTWRQAYDNITDVLGDVDTLVSNLGLPVSQ
jgi:hypothetical protein